MAPTRVLRLGTRGSALALWQARTVAGLLQQRGSAVELVTIKTSGDRLQEAPLSETGGKRLFVKEIEDALLRGEIDLAVHSAKDMPAVLPDGLEVGATLPREDPRDALVLPGGGGTESLEAVLDRLGRRPTIATGSVRRVAQLMALIPGAAFVPMRGNVDTRLRKLDDGGANALVLAAAGMRRLGFAPRISVAVPLEQCIPAPGQGIVAIEIRSDAAETRRAVGAIHDHAAGGALEAERSLVAALGGGCQLPLGGIAIPDGPEYDMQAIVTSLDGRRVVKRRARGSMDDPASLGRRVAGALASAGASDILDEVRAQ